MAQRLVESAEWRGRLAAIFLGHPLLCARRVEGSGTASLLGGRALAPPFDRAGFLAVEWSPTPRQVDQLIEALDVVAAVARCLDARLDRASFDDE